MARQLVIALALLASLAAALLQGQDTVSRPRVPTPAAAARPGMFREAGPTAARLGAEPSARGSISSSRSREDRVQTRSNRGPQLAEPERVANSVPAHFDDDSDEFDQEVGALPSVLKRRPGSMEPAELPDSKDTEVNPSFTSRRPLAPPAELPLDEPVEVASRPPGGSRLARSRATTRPMPESEREREREIQITSRTPMVRLDVMGPQAVTIGKPARYVISAVNEGSETARQLEVQLKTPPHAQLDGLSAVDGQVQQVDEGSAIWTLPQLAGGSRSELQLMLTPQRAQPIDLVMDWSVHPQAVSASIEVQQPELLVEIAGPSAVLFGERQIYTITLTNPGTGPAENVTLDVATGGGAQSKQMGTIPAGGREQIRMELVARESGELEIASVATADGLRHEARKNILVRRAELTVEISAPRLKFAGSSGTYEVSVRNTGNAAANDLEISLRKPAGVRYLAGVENAVESGGRIGWQLAQLDAGKHRLYQLEVMFDQAGEVVCEAVVSTADELTASAAIETRVEAVADLKLALQDPDSPQVVGEEVTYEVRVANRGTKDSGSITILGHFSEGIEPIRATGGPAELITGQVVFEPISGVKAGETLLLKVVARAEKSGNHRFRAVVKCDDPEIEVIAESVTRFFGEEGSSQDAAAPARVSRSSSSSSTVRR
jgi:uncharacterized repeat protein (TIGR01451 family)